MEKGFDVIIPVAIKDAPFIRRTLNYVFQNLEGVGNVYIIASRKLFGVIKKRTKNIERCILLDEDTIVDGLSFFKLNSFLKQKGFKRTGWLFQQFLKLGFAQSSYCDKDYYLSWDADTIPLRKISFFDYEHPFFTRKGEFHKPYFDAIKRLLNMDKSVDFSFIAEHMLFNKAIVIQMLRDIELHNDGTWLEAILSNVDFNEPNCFSEFETYGTYCANRHKDLYHIRFLNTLRCGALIRGPFITPQIIDELSFDLDTVSLEIWHKPSFPWNIPHFFLRIYVKMLKKYISQWKEN